MRPELFAPIGLASETPKQFLLLDDRRIPNTPTLTDEIAAWPAEPTRLGVVAIRDGSPPKAHDHAASRVDLD